MQCLYGSNLSVLLTGCGVRVPLQDGDAKGGVVLRLSEGQVQSWQASIQGMVQGLQHQVCGLGASLID